MISTRPPPRDRLDKTFGSQPLDAPLIRALSANGKTAGDLFRRSGWAPLGFILEGSAGGWFDGRFSLFGGSPFALFQSKGEVIRIDHGGRTRSSTGDPMMALQAWLDRFRSPAPPEEGAPSIPFLQGGAIGFFSYDLARRFEKIPPPIEDDPTLPDIFLLFLNFFGLLDHAQDRLYLIYHPRPEIVLGKERASAYKEGEAKIEALRERLSDSRFETTIDDRDPAVSPLRIEPDLAPRTYIQMVRRAREYIGAGDIFQANLSHRFRATAPSLSSFEVYRRLREINPSPFSAYLNLGEIQIASASPERLIRIEGLRIERPGAERPIERPGAERLIETRPIAGTRPRGRDASGDEAMVRALYASEKERAEHLMLVDLERNDLGKVCRYGSVQVEKWMALEKYSHVMHLVSHVRGELRPEVSFVEALQAVFPGGTITGAPKIRCMEIISELERRSRGVYTGAIGYIGFNGEADLNIAIRTCVQRGNEITFQVGAGIVADSDPEMEYQETLQKAAALIQALERTGPAAGERRPPNPNPRN